MWSVYFHALPYGGWLLVNLGRVPGVKPFDPSLVALAVCASVEAIFLSTFIMISQNRMQHAAERRAELDLQLSLLTEHELTRAIHSIDDVAHRLGAYRPPEPELRIKRDVEPEKVVEVIEKVEQRMERITMSSRSPRARYPLRDKLGICQWFHFEDYAAVERTLALMEELNLQNLRTGISWADYCRPGGKAWYDWQMKQTAKLDVLLSIWHTPPSLAVTGKCYDPPRRLLDYADFIDRVFTDYGDAFDHLELWNEPNNRIKWNFPEHDPQWRKFGQMIGAAAHWAKRRGGRTVLGGRIPVDHHWLALMRDYGVLEHVDVVGIHGFPGMWFPHNPNWDWHGKWQGWDAKVDYIRAHAGGRPIWVTETGVATWDLAHHREGKYDLQVKLLREAAAAPAERVYWYQMIDLDPARDAIEGFHVDENEYHMGLVKHDGHRKFAFAEMKQLLRATAPSVEVHAPAGR